MHAVLAPSSSHRWVNCPGSVQAEQKYPDDETDESREGTAAHWVGEQVLLSWKDGRKLILCSDFVGKSAPNSVIITDEMCEGADIYVQDVLKICQDGGYLRSMQIEQPVTIPRVHDLNWGTPDCKIHAEDQSKLIIWDFKFGRVPVENRKNWQLIDYTIGCLDTITGGNGLADQHIKVEMRIVQPRAFHPDGVCREWTVTGSDLRGYANQLSVAADLSQQQDPPCKAGDWCKHCTASRGCMTLQREAASIADHVEVLELHDLSPEHSAIELRYLQRAKTLLDQRFKALEAQTLEQIQGGTVVPGYGIGHGRGSTVWTKPNEEVITLGDLLGVQLRKPEAPITPIQAKKLNVDDAVINSYSEKRPGAARLVTDDKTIACRVFSNN